RDLRPQSPSRAQVGRDKYLPLTHSYARVQQFAFANGKLSLPARNEHCRDVGFGLQASCELLPCFVNWADSWWRFWSNTEPALHWDCPVHSRAGDASCRKRRCDQGRPADYLAACYCALPKDRSHTARLLPRLWP